MPSDQQIAEIAARIVQMTNEVEAVRDGVGALRRERDMWRDAFARLALEALNNKENTSADH